MRKHDWSNSPLGHPETWPQSLRSVVGLLLNSKFPMFVAWGEQLGFLYNDSYAEILGAAPRLERSWRSTVSLACSRRLASARRRARLARTTKIVLESSVNA